MEKKELKVGKYVWWKGQSFMTQVWSCPCIVTYIGRKGFKVQSFDDFEESELLHYRVGARKDQALSVLLEMRVCDTEEVKEYLKRTGKELSVEKSVLGFQLRKVANKLKQNKKILQSLRG
jgi:hypothetical protein